jgi:hypothetical protein
MRIAFTVLCGLLFVASTILVIVNFTDMSAWLSVLGVTIAELSFIFMWINLHHTYLRRRAKTR